MKSETLFLKIIINELNFLRKTAILKWNYWRKKKKRFAVACEQINRKIPDPCNGKEHYQSFIQKKNTTSVKQSEIITYQPNTFGKPKYCWYKISYYRKSKSFAWTNQDNKTSWKSRF